ncbi:alpha/beta hydrolase [uncultured Arthrobacter sp.]|uniref:alpha/beta hydrolase n=1 Tax=uncultured Arthrobacter sp. TaxID=114050 RepID=UPI00262DCEAA|nr:alpha/beta hydrolase [uncultured Arthrobacter sp.]
MTGIPRQRYTYGKDPSQFADLYLPAGQASPGVVVIIHGGFWRSRYTLELGVPLAEDLSSRGSTCWNLEYRRVGNGGGWPQTFEDIAAGIDLLSSASKEHGLDTSTTTALGHSAGGHLAVWAAGRSSLPADAPGGGVPAVPITGVVSQSGVLNLQLADEERLGDGAVRDFLGEPNGTKYQLADPMRALPLPVPVLALHGEEDTTVPLSQSASYVDAARAADATAELVQIPGDHFAMITPGTVAWTQVVAAVERLT